MTPRDFCIWLEGYLASAANSVAGDVSLEDYIKPIFEKIDKVHHDDRPDKPKA